MSLHHQLLLDEKKLHLAELLIIVSFAILPLFVTFPYRVNIFLSWEGAYRLYQGQVPYRDFGLPLGFVYWIIPALFFKLFGPFLFTLVKAQVFINIISGIAFSTTLRALGMEAGRKLVAVFLFCLSYSFFNFWPWYNHTVFVYQLIGMAFVLLVTSTKRNRTRLAFAALGGIFVTLSFFTKQDGGALAILLCFVLLGYDAILEKDIKPLFCYICMILLTSSIFILPFLRYDFSYWFNYGQPPHTSRISIYDIVDEFFLNSPWLKFYLIVIIIILLHNVRNLKDYIFQKQEVLFFLTTLGILAEAAIIQVTSYTPPNNNIYFHSFAFAYIISHLHLTINFKKLKYIVLFIALILIWWSDNYYKYIQRIVNRIIPPSTVSVNTVNRHSYIINTDTTYVNVEINQWQLSDFPVFHRVYMPPSTIEGINKLQQLTVIKEKDSPKVLNMTELTPLAHILNYDLESEQPLWYHLNVSMFQREIDLLCERVANNYYDVILFEDIPNLNNFFPYPIRNCLQKHYQLHDTFLAPRYPTNATIEVYIQKP